MVQKNLKKSKTSSDSASLRQDLQRRLEQVENYEGSLNSAKIAKQNELKEKKAGIIRSLFKAMEEMGVDFKDLNSINNFLQKLQTQDPDLARLFEIAFTRLTSDMPGMPATSLSTAETEEVGGEEQRAGLMNKYNNLARQVMQPRK